MTRAEILHFVRRQWLALLLPVLVALGSALVYLNMTKPIFTARAELLIDPKLPHPLRESSGDASFFFDAPQLESQIAVLRSERVARAVISALHLEADDEFNGTGSPGLTAQLLQRSRPASDVEQKVRNAIASFRDRLDLRRIGTSYAIEVSFPSKSAARAADIVNATTSAYLADIVEARASAARQGSNWLEERVHRLRLKMNEAARRVQEFRASHDYRIQKRPEPGPLGLRPQDDTAEGSSPATLEELESTAATYRRIYENFYQAFAEAVQRESYPVSNARVISAAIPPGGKSHPKSPLVLAFAGLAGVLSGVAIALIRNSLSKTITSEHVVRSELGLSCMAQIPKVRSGPIPTVPERIRMFLSSVFQWRTGHSQTLLRSPLLLRYAADAATSPFGRAIRSIRTALSLEGKTRPVRFIGVTSAFANEGKTTIAANLATLYASPSSPVLLVDADIYRGTLSQDLATGSTDSFIEVILGEKSLAMAIRHSEVDGLDLLPMSLNTASLKAHDDVLSSSAIQTFIADAAKHYATIIFDLPPLKVAADGYVLASRLDGVILVAEMNATPVDALEDIVATLRSARARILGLVLNKVPTAAMQTTSHRSTAYY